MPARVRILFTGNDAYLNVTLTDNADDSAVTTATVTAVLYEADKTTEVTGGNTWPQALAHVSAGLYRGVLLDSNALADHTKYVAKIIADDGADRRAVWWVPVRAIDRFE